MEYIVYILSALTLTLLSPAIAGVMRKASARICGETSGGILEPYRDLITLFEHGAVVHGNSSWVATLSSRMVFVITLVLATSVPVAHTSTFSATSDFTIFIYLLLATTFFASLFMMDSIEKFDLKTTVISITSKAGLIVPLATVALTIGSTKLSSMSYQFLSMQISHSVPFILSGVAFFLILVMETEFERDPSNVAPMDAHFAFFEWALFNKVLILMVLFANIFIPLNLASSFTVLDILTAMIVFFAKITTIAIFLAIVRRKIMILGAPFLLAMSYALSVVALLIV